MIEEWCKQWRNDLVQYHLPLAYCYLFIRTFRIPSVILVRFVYFELSVCFKTCFFKDSFIVWGWILITDYREMMANMCACEMLKYEKIWVKEASNCLWKHVLKILSEKKEIHNTIYVIKGVSLLNRCPLIMKYIQKFPII